MITAVMYGFGSERSLQITQRKVGIRIWVRASECKNVETNIQE